MTSESDDGSERIMNRTLIKLTCDEKSASFSLSVETVSVASLLSMLIILLSYNKQKRNRQGKAGDSQWERKQDFLSRVGTTYGYKKTNGGFIDDWRPKELPSLQLPVLKNQINDSSEREVYLDYAGSALPTASQLQKIYTQYPDILANPHSTGPSASRTSRGIEEAKKKILTHFKAAPGRFASLNNPPSSFPQADCHPGYEILFTSGATEAFQIIAERFPWKKACDGCGRKSILLYAHNSHSSVVGMREVALAHGASFQCCDLHRIQKMTKDDFLSIERQDMKNKDGGENCCSCRGCKFCNLLVISAECNFGGTRPNSKSIISTAKASGWYTMLDIAKAASTTPVDLREESPDFASLSFYKIFGAPTGLGCLFVKRPTIPLLLKNENCKQHYVGGGSLNLILTKQKFSSRTESIESFKSGTPDFRGILSLKHGFDEIDRLGGISVIHRHTITLAKELSRRLRGLVHGNGQPAVLIYGQWGDESATDAGPTIPLNIIRYDGSFVGYNEVAKLAALNKPAIQFRTGCFCNPGACQRALNLTDEELLYNFQIAGHVCGDHMDLIKDQPTGAVRISFGKDSIWEDLDEFVLFLQRNFVKNSIELARSLDIPRGPSQVTLTELYVFPIKSCSAQRVSRWKVDTVNGKMLHDREFALVDSSGTALRLQNFPKMGMISPVIDLDTQSMVVKAPGCCDLILSLEANESNGCNNDINVCGNKCPGILWGDYKTSEWFSSFLGIQCWLARYPNHPSSKGSGFANDQPLLLISDNAVETLNSVLVEQNQSLVGTKHFRPNLVVKSSSKYGWHIEDGWTQLLISNKRLAFEVKGNCARCSMVDFDPYTGQKGKTLRALAKYRRKKGQITFGIFLKAILDDASLQKEKIWIEEGEKIKCLNNI